MTRSEVGVLGEILAHTTGATALAPTTGKRASGRRISSRHFDAAPSTPPACRSVSSESRSEYFKSSPDSCAGSAISFDWGSAFTEQAFLALKACERFEQFGVRHICENLCYLRAYEPFRKWHALRSAVAKAGSSTRVLDGWSVRMDGGQSAERSWRIKYVSPDGIVFPSAKPALVALGLAQQVMTDCPTSPPSVRRKRRTPTSSPQQVCTTTRHYSDGPTYLLKEPPAGAFPPSPFGLIEELLTDDPWKLLIGCIMLNQTTRSQMDPVLHLFLEKFPTAAIAAAASVKEITQVVAPLGLQERRPIAIIRFSQEYLSKPWKNPEELYWVGKYASDAHKVFIEGKWREVQPNDHALNWWVEWMRGTQQAEGVHPTAAEPSGPQLQGVGADGLFLAGRGSKALNAEHR